jgi:hypothetical protein
MSMIGKLRQVSEFDLARYKKNPGELVRALSAGKTRMDPHMYEQMRETLQQNPAVQRMMELVKQGKVPTREEQVEMQLQMAQFAKQAKDMARLALGVPQGSCAKSPEEPPTGELDLHKSWHCLHFLLTGKVEGSDGTALGDAILGGAEIGGEEADMGYGPPRGLSPGQVRSVAAALSEFPIGQKAKAFDAEAADGAGVYVAKHGEEELREYFQQLHEFYEDAASKGNAMLLWIE